MNILLNLNGEYVGLVERKEAMATYGLCELLRYILNKRLHLQELALRLLFSFAYGSSKTRQKLQENGGVEFLFNLLKQPEHINWNSNIIDVLATL